MDIDHQDKGSALLFVFYVRRLFCYLLILHLDRTPLKIIKQCLWTCFVAHIIERRGENVGPSQAAVKIWAGKFLFNPLLNCSHKKLHFKFAIHQNICKLIHTRTWNLIHLGNMVTLILYAGFCKCFVKLYQMCINVILGKSNL